MCVLLFKYLTWLVYEAYVQDILKIGNEEFRILCIILLDSIRDYV